MICRYITAALLACSIAGFTACSTAPGDKEGPEVVVPADQLPSAVRAGFARESGGIAVRQADKEMYKDKMIYEADVVMNGQNYEIKLAEDGTLVSKSADNEEDEKPEK